MAPGVLEVNDPGWRTAMKRSAGVFAILSAVFLLSGGVSFGGIADVNQGGQQLQPTSAPGMIYVADFALDAAEVQGQGGLLGHGGLRPGGLLRRRGPLRQQQDPAATAAKLVNLLAESITQKLREQAVPAQRVARGRPLPDSGWLVRGRFLQVSEGNRLQRAVIGFGAGATDMQIQVEVCNLRSHSATPFLTFGSDAGSGRKPGAVVTMNPYVAAAKFVLSKNASEKDVRHAGGQIASEIIGYMQRRGLIVAR